MRSEVITVHFEAHIENFVRLIFDCIVSKIVHFLSMYWTKSFLKNIGSAGHVWSTWHNVYRGVVRQTYSVLRRVFLLAEPHSSAVGFVESRLTEMRHLAIQHKWEFPSHAKHSWRMSVFQHVSDHCWRWNNFFSCYSMSARLGTKLSQSMCHIPANTIHWFYAGSMLDQSLRRFPNIEPASNQCIMFARMCLSYRIPSFAIMPWFCIKSYSNKRRLFSP